jgi:hypothetical protein
MVEPFDVDQAERLLREAEAVLAEFTPTLDEVADRFTSERFEARVTGDDARLVRLAEDARTAAEIGRHIASLYEAFASGVELHSLELCRVAAGELQRLAEREFRYTISDIRGDVQDA